MTRSILDEVQAWLVEHVAGWFGPLLDYAYLGGWYTIGIVLLAACLAIGYFFSFTWVRAVLGFILIFYGAFLGGLQVMFNHLKREKHVTQKPPPPEPTARHQGGSWPF